MSKVSTAITASVIAGVVIGSTVGAIVKTAHNKKPKSKLKKGAHLAAEAIGEVLHNVVTMG